MTQRLLTAALLALPLQGCQASESTTAATKMPVPAATPAVDAPEPTARPATAANRPELSPGACKKTDDGFTTFLEAIIADPAVRAACSWRQMTGDRIEYGQSVGIQGGFNKGDPKAFGKHVHVDINASYLPQADRYIRDMDSGAITTDQRPQHAQPDRTGPARVSDISGMAGRLPLRLAPRP